MNPNQPPREELPLHVADQLDAATKETSQQLDRFGAWLTRLGEEVDRSTMTGTLDPLTRKLLAEPMERGEVGSCPHLASPQPAIVHASRPGFMWCQKCATRKMLKWVRKWVNLQRCDGCGKDTDVLGVAVIQQGPLMLQGFLCTDCSEATR